ncbi:MAG TPA: hypothetical protein VIH57_20315, partial [Bacteroidales bacterium]
GRSADEQSVVRIKNGKYLGFGFISKDFPVTSTETLADYIKSYPDNREVQQIIRNYLKKHPFAKVIRD